MGNIISNSEIFSLNRKKTASFIRYIDNLENIPFISSAISTFTYTVKVLDNFENKQQVRMK